MLDVTKIEFKTGPTLDRRNTVAVASLRLASEKHIQGDRPDSRVLHAAEIDLVAALWKDAYGELVKPIAELRRQAAFLDGAYSPISSYATRIKALSDKLSQLIEMPEPPTS